MVRAILIIAAWFCLTFAHASEPQTAVVFGESITAGSSKPKADKDKVWVSLIGNQSEGRLNMINEGKGGRPTDSIKEFTEMLARKTWPAGLRIVILGPTNIRKDALGPTRPIADQRGARLQELGAAFEKLARELQCDYLSLYGVIPPASLAVDGVHPDVAGNEAIAKAVLPLLLTR